MHEETISSSCLRLIKELSEIQTLSQFYLVGGTSLSLQLGHRRSIDLDFFTQQYFDTDNLNQLLSEKFSLNNPKITEKTLRTAIRRIKTEFIYFAYPNLYPLIEWNGIKMLSAIDIGLYKLIALIGRQTKKDIVDLYFLDKMVIPIEDLFQVFIQKYSKGDIELFKDINLIFNDENIKKTSRPVMLYDFKWDMGYNYVKSKIISSVEKHLL
jgi:hypothetical protein